MSSTYVPSTSDAGTYDADEEALNRTEKQYPLAPHVLNAKHYRDPAQHEREIERIFMESWFPVCPSVDLSEPRDYVVWDRLQPVVIVRLDDGSVAAWYNVCQHRGARLIQKSGRCEAGRF